MDLDKCKTMAKAVADTFLRNSEGKLKLVPSAISIKSLEAAGPKASSEIANKLRADDKAALYILPQLFYAGASHAGSRVAILNKYLGTGTATHVVGHLLGLGHCGAYKVDPKTDKEYYDQYVGGGCLMSGFFGSTAYLAPSQYLWLDWYEKDEYEVYNGLKKEFELKKLSNLTGKGLSTVVIPPQLLGGGRAGYVSYWHKCENEPCLVFYYGQGGGSQRVKIFGKEFYDEKSGLKIQNLGGGATKVNVLITFEKK